MISFLQNALQKHYKWLFSILLVIITVSFVFTIGASPGIGRSKVKNRDFYGYNLNSEEDIKNLFQSTSLAFILNTGEEPGNPRDLEQAGLARAIFLSLADTLLIPNPTEEQLVKYIQNLKFFKNELGIFDNKQYESFTQSIQFSSKFPAGFVRQCLVDNYRIEQIQVALRGPSYVLDSELINYLEKLETKWTLQVATLDMDSFKPDITIDDASIETFFETNRAAYTIPAQYKCSYLLFDKNKFFEKIEDPDNATLEAYYNRQYQILKEQLNISSREQGWSLHKEQIKTAYKEAKAKRDAATAANQFIYALYDQEIENHSMFFEQLLREHHVLLRDIPIFSYNTLPDSPQFSQEIWNQAFTLTPKQYYSNVVAYNGSAVILILQDIIPQRIPELAEVREAVINDYLLREKEIMFIEQSQRVEKILAQSTSPDGFIKTAKKEGLSVTQLKNISIQATPEEYTTLSSLQDLNIGKVSQVIFQKDKASLAYVEKKEKPVITAQNDNWHDVALQLSLIAQVARTQGIITELIDSGIIRADNS